MGHPAPPTSSSTPPPSPVAHARVLDQSDLRPRCFEGRGQGGDVVNGQAQGGNFRQFLMLAQIRLGHNFSKLVKRVVQHVHACTFPLRRAYSGHLVALRRFPFACDGINTGRFLEERRKCDAAVVLMVQVLWPLHLVVPRILGRCVNRVRRTKINKTGRKCGNIRAAGRVTHFAVAVVSLEEDWIQRTVILAVKAEVSFVPSFHTHRLAHATPI